MIEQNDGVFMLSTQHTSYWLRITPFGHIEHIHFGLKIAAGDPEPLIIKRTATTGGSVVYDQTDPLYCLKDICLEWSGIGRGDYRHSPAELKMPDGSFVCDFLYRSHRIYDGTAPMHTLPGAYDDTNSCQTLELTLIDESNDVELVMYYTVFEQTDVITRRCVLKNNNTKPLVIRRLMSLMLDMPNRGFRLITFDGGWIKEAHKHERVLQYGLFVNQSTTGASSHWHNPGFLLAAENATESYGDVYGFNLIYSGNHYGAADLSSEQLLRVMIGINPHCFEWQLKKRRIL